MPYSSRQRVIIALEGKQVFGRVPHFELVFFLTMEAFGRVHPRHRSYAQWEQMEEAERELHRKDMADIFIMTAEKYEHDAIFLHHNPQTLAEALRLIETVREKSGDKYFLMKHGDATYGVPDGNNMLEFTYRMADDAGGLKRDAVIMVENAIREAEKIKAHGGLDGFVLCTDYCLNANPFLSPHQFGEFVTPYLARLIKAYRDMGFYVIKHTDGNIMPIIDQLAQANPHALHSLDPQAGVDIAEVKKKYGQRMCLIGNVNCGLLQTGSEDDVRESACYALKHGMPGGGYVFSTSNCIYPGMPLKRYEIMLNIWRKEGNYGY